jgi:hypothetical protein
MDIQKLKNKYIVLNKKNTGFAFDLGYIKVLTIKESGANYYNLRYWHPMDKRVSSVLLADVTVGKIKVIKKKEEKKADLELNKYLEQNLNSMLPFGHTIGSDPEIFAVNKKGDLIPAFDFLGSKEKPSKSFITHISNFKNDLYWDGFQAEFTTKASTCMGWHGDSIRDGLKGIYDHLKRHNPEAKLSIKTVMDIPPKLLTSSAPEHVAFGCMKSLNVYGMKGIDLPGDQVDYRSAGGHIHFGCGKLQALDAVLGVMCVSLFEGHDDPRRRLMYGLAGEYRLPPHGLEYRTLSNAWLSHPLIANIVFDVGRKAFALGEMGLLKLWDGNPQETVDCINNCDVKKAREILKRNEAIFKKIIKGAYYYEGKVNFVHKIIMEGMNTVLVDAGNIERNWNLNGHWIAHCNAKNANVAKCVDSGEGKF